MANFSQEEARYYSRHFSLPEIGEAGQEKLKSASVLLIGLGGLGSPLSLYLAAAGVGRLGVVEFDQIDASNLHRQILYGSSQEGQAKIDCAVKRLRDLNPHVLIQAHPMKLTRENARELVRKYDCVADGADNFQTRYLVNDACILERKPLISAAISGFEGQLSVFGNQGGPCYRCLYPEPPPPGAVSSCAEGGVLGVLPGVMGTLQATEVIKLVLGLGSPLSGKLLTYDALTMDFNQLRFERRKDCSLCGDSPSQRELMNYDEFCGVVPEISPLELRTELKRHLIIDVREDEERASCKIDPSTHIPLDQLLSGNFELPKDRSIVVYCKMGGRSARAAQYLKKQGYERVMSLSGGITSWLDLGELRNAMRT